VRSNHKAFVAILSATIWISISEFVRNELLLKSYWLDHYGELGIVFPSGLVNGAIRGLWSLVFAIFIYFLSRKFSLIGISLLAWFAGFPLMWIVIWNLNVLPIKLIPFAVPLSLLEAFLAVCIIGKISPLPSNEGQYIFPLFMKT